MNARGFPLLGLLVALAILGIAVVACIQGFAQGLRLLKLAGDHQDAMLLADEKLREAGTPSAEGRDEGTSERFAWTRSIARVATPELVTVTRPARWSVYQIDVEVRWDERRAVHLTTLRTVPDTPPPSAARPGQTGRPAGTTGTTGTATTPRAPGRP